MIVPTSNLFKLAYGKYAIGAYNINNGLVGEMTILALGPFNRYIGLR
jgi:hypothetical protein